MSDPTRDLPPAAGLISHHVADFDRWKVGFDEHESARRDAGILGHHLQRAEADPNLITIFLPLSDIAKAQEFAASKDLQEKMAELGVQGPPDIRWMTPARQNVVWDRELPGFILSHRVDDFDAWLEGYDGAGELRAERGIIGDAANRSMDDPSEAIVYHQAETFDALRNFLDDADLKVVMKEAGVISEPEVTFHTGGWGRTY